MNFNKSFYEYNFETLMFADDQIIIVDNEDSLQIVFCEVQEIIRMYSSEISVMKTKSMAFKGCFPIRCKLVVNGQLIKQMHSLFTFDVI